MYLLFRVVISLLSTGLYCQSKTVLPMRRMADLPHEVKKQLAGLAGMRITVFNSLFSSEK